MGTPGSRRDKKLPLSPSQREVIAVIVSILILGYHAILLTFSLTER